MATRPADRYSGDPRIVLGPEGADLDYRGGQPVMDQGLENQALLSLFTTPGWVGNTLLPVERRVGSDFEETAAQAITLQGLADVANAAERALKSPFFPELAVAVTNPVGNRLAVAVTLGPGRTLGLTRVGLAWQAQRENPASGRVS